MSNPYQEMLSQTNQWKQSIQGDAACRFQLIVRSQDIRDSNYVFRFPSTMTNLKGCAVSYFTVDNTLVNISSELNNNLFYFEYGVITHHNEQNQTEFNPVVGQAHWHPPYNDEAYAELYAKHLNVAHDDYTAWLTHLPQGHYFKNKRSEVDYVSVGDNYQDFEYEYAVWSYYNALHNKYDPFIIPDGIYNVPPPGQDDSYTGPLLGINICKWIKDTINTYTPQWGCYYEGAWGYYNFHFQPAGGGGPFDLQVENENVFSDDGTFPMYPPTLQQWDIQRKYCAVTQVGIHPDGHFYIKLELPYNRQVNNTVPYVGAMTWYINPDQPLVLYPIAEAPLVYSVQPWPGLRCPNLDLKTRYSLPLTNVLHILVAPWDVLGFVEENLKDPYDYPENHLTKGKPFILYDENDHTLPIDVLVEENWNIHEKFNNTELEYPGADWILNRVMFDTWQMSSVYTKGDDIDDKDVFITTTYLTAPNIPRLYTAPSIYLVIHNIPPATYVLKYPTEYMRPRNEVIIQGTDVVPPTPVLLPILMHLQLDNDLYTKMVADIKTIQVIQFPNYFSLSELQFDLVDSGYRRLTDLEWMCVLRFY